MRHPPDDASHSPCDDQDDDNDDDEDDECQYSMPHVRFEGGSSAAVKQFFVLTQSDVMLGRSRIGSNTTGQLDDTEIAKAASCPGR